MPRNSDYFEAIGSVLDSYWSFSACFWKAGGARELRPAIKRFGEMVWYLVLAQEENNS